MQSETAQKLFAEMKAHEIDEKACERQANRLALTKGDVQKTSRRTFIKLFTTSKMGLNITSTGAGRRDTTVQSNFRCDLIKAYDSKHSDPKKAFLWCPILKTWCLKQHTTAAHLFAYMHTQECMDAIFGPSNPPELSSSLNGMIISNAVEAKFDLGFMAIVPGLPEHPSAAEITLWNSTQPKEYKVRILDFDAYFIDHQILPESEQTWRQLDGSNLEFRNDFRPRARYLYFHYIVQILRKSWKEQAKGTTLKKELHKQYWGTPGRYIAKSMLQAFVEEIGAEHENLLVGAVDDDPPAGGDDQDVLLAVVSNQVKASGVCAEEDSEEDSEDEISD